MRRGFILSSVTSLHLMHYGKHLSPPLPFFLFLRQQILFE